MDPGNSIASDNQEVEKTLFDAEQFLSNYASLREECDRLKSENHELQLRLQQVSQDVHQIQLDKQHLEDTLNKERLEHKETIWTLKLESQKSQEERLTWKEKYLDVCIKSSSQAITRAVLSQSKDVSTSTDLSSLANKVASSKMDRLARPGRKPVRKRIITRRSAMKSAADDLAADSDSDDTVEHAIAPALDSVPGTRKSSRRRVHADRLLQEAPMVQDLTETQSSIACDADLSDGPSSLAATQFSENPVSINVNQSQLASTAVISSTLGAQTSIASVLDANVVVIEPEPDSQAASFSSVNPDLVVTSTTMRPAADLVSAPMHGISLSPAEVTAVGQVVATDGTGYYQIGATTFEITPAPPDQAVPPNARTFILQTSEGAYPALLHTTEQPANVKFASSVRYKQEDSSPAFPSNSPDSTGFHCTDETDDRSKDDDDNMEYNFRCHLCTFTYSDQHGLDKHMSAKHGVKKFMCKQCGKAYGSRSSLSQHVTYYHKKPGAYTCEVCNKKFNRKDFLTKHLKVHTSERTLSCQYCDKAFKTNASLSAHVNGVHNESRRFICDYCGLQTSWRLSHLEHMKIHTGEPRKYMKRKEAAKLAEHIVHSAEDLQTLAGKIRLEGNDNSLLEHGAIVQFIPVTQ